MVVALAGVALSGLRSLIIRGGLVGLLVNLTLFSVFAAGYLKTALVLRFLIAVLLVSLGVVAVFSDRRQKAGPRNKAVILAIAIFVLATTLLSLSGASAGELDKFFRYFIVLPAAFVAGVQVATSNSIQQWTTSYRFWTVVFASIATSEFLMGRLFSPREGFNVSLGSLTFRSLALSEHSLVLATMLLAGVPYLFALTSRFLKLASIGLVGVAIWTTGSEGPQLLFVLVVLSAWLVSFRSFDPLKLASAFKLIVFSAFAGLIAVGAFLAQNRAVIVTSTSDEASAQYRLALYATVWPSLVERPIGFGLTGIPEGALLIQSAGRILDIARTIDSEYVMLILEFGWLGMLICVVVLAVVFGRNGLRSPLGISTMLISAAGFFLAIHAWLGLGTLWLIQLGMLHAQGRAARKSSDALSIAGRSAPQELTTKTRN